MSEAAKEIRAFIEKSDKPDEQKLVRELSEAHTFYAELMKLTSGFSNEWNHSKNGWTQKIFDNKKALFYVIPLAGAFRISMTIRESEREIFLHDGEFSYLHPQLESAKKYSEGYLMQFLVTEKNSFEECARFIKKLILLRNK